MTDESARTVRCTDPDFNDEFRRNADECRQQAERSRNHLDKERWLKIAEHWLQMAQEAEAEPQGNR